MQAVGTSSKSDELRSRVTGWLLADGWTLKEAPPSQTEGSAWLVQAADPSGRHLALGQRLSRDDALVVQGSVMLDPRHAEKLAALDASEQEDFCWDLRLRLLEHVDFKGVSVPLKGVNLLARIYVEDMTRTSFFSTLSQVQRAILTVVWTVRRKLDQPISEGDLRGSDIENLTPN